MDKFEYYKARKKEVYQRVRDAKFNEALRKKRLERDIAKPNVKFNRQVAMKVRELKVRNARVKAVKELPSKTINTINNKISRAYKSLEVGRSNKIRGHSIRVKINNAKIMRLAGNVSGKVPVRPFSNILTGKPEGDSNGKAV